MNIWNTNQLAADLASEALSQQQKAQYYIACFYLQIASTVLPMYFLGYSFYLNIVTFASYVATLAVFHVGAMSVYKACSGYKKAGVLDTIVVLSLPVCLKIQLVYWLSYALIALLFAEQQSAAYVWLIYSFVAMPVMVWCQFYLIKKAVQQNYA